MCDRKILLTLIAVILISFSQAQDIHCLGLKNITIDGKPDEWPQPFRYYEGTTKLQFAFSNDTGNLYICLKITDEVTQLRLFNSGLNIWVDPKGKKKEAVGLFFPIAQAREPGEGGGQKRHHQGGDESGDQATQKTDQFRLRRHARAQQLTLHIKGFMGVPEQVLPLENSFGISAAFDWDTFDILTIEYKLPLALVLGHVLSATDTVKAIGVGFVEPAPEAPHIGASNGGIQEGETGAGDVSTSNGGLRNLNNGSNMGGMGQGGYNNGMGGGGGMGRGGGGRGGGSHSAMDTNPANQEQKVWSKVFLRYKLFETTTSGPTPKF
jgi:hypothetical protein